MPKGLYTRNGIYWARFKIKGVEYRESLRTRSEAKAERNLKALKEKIAAQVYFGEGGPTAWPDAVISWSQKGPRALGIKLTTFNRYLVSFIQLRPWLDDKDVHQIDVKLLKKIVADRQKQGVSNATVRRDLTAISSVLAHCVDLDWLEENPAKMIDRSRFKEDRTPIILPREESMALVFAIAGRFMDMAEFSLETGMREEEVASLEHDRIDRKRMSATLEATKNGEPREVPLSARALEILDRQPRHFKHSWCFWRANGERFQNIASQFYAKTGRVARKAAQEGKDFRRFRFHDLRHLFAVRYLRERRGSLYDLQHVLGHSSVQTTEGYLKHLKPDEKLAAMHGVAQNPAQVQRSE
ncbi:putative integrase [Sphingobium sp. SYK-6]|uniref:tyrosine-type recombinase/integrase n=1 Tax=Sphingobium sp. (strain NBRC 103272 / SYK-6) TaxID=627192 RepID=UPI000227709C|nr:site-specific integrase [Sphingobium sp. SYK-6]BAK66836.1 putative integrase [Sphingobium sp. SYK-6]